MFQLPQIKKTTKFFERGGSLNENEILWIKKILRRGVGTFFTVLLI